MTSDLHGLAAAYSLGALDDQERAAFEAHLEECAECTAEISGFAGVVESLADSASVVPPDHLKASVMSQLGDVPQELRAPDPAASPSPVSAAPATETAPPSEIADLGEHRRRRFPAAGLLAAAAAIAVIAVGAIVMTADRGGSDFDDVVAASDAVVTQLEGEGGAFEVAYSAELDRVALRGEGVDDLAPGLRYALWAIADGTPIPAGLFEPDDGSIDDVVEFADVSAEAWGITIEPESGSDTPTPPIISLGET